MKAPFVALPLLLAVIATLPLRADPREDEPVRARAVDVARPPGSLVLPPGGRARPPDPLLPAARRTVERAGELVDRAGDRLARLLAPGDGPDGGPDDDGGGGAPALAPEAPPPAGCRDMLRIGRALRLDLWDEYDEFRVDLAEHPDLRFRDWLRDDWETSRNWGAGLMGGSLAGLGIGLAVSLLAFDRKGAPSDQVLGAGITGLVTIIPLTLGTALFALYQSRLSALDDAMGAVPVMDEDPDDGPPPASGASWTRPDRAERTVDDMEWFGMNLGGGIAGHCILPNCLVSDLLFFTVRWERFYWTVLEGKPTFMMGFAGGGGRAGWRVPLSDDRVHELRLGIGLAVGWFCTWEGSNADGTGGGGFGPILTPHVQYVRNTGQGTVGVGLDVPIGIGTDVLAGLSGGIAAGPMLYFRWSVH